MNREDYMNDEFSMGNGNINGNGLKPQQDYRNVQPQYEVPQSTGISTMEGTTSQPLPQQRPDPTPISPDMWKHGTQYEVKDDETFAFYEGFVVDFKESEKKVQVVYRQNWKPPQYLDVSYLRPVPTPVSAEAWDPREGERIECMAKAEEFEPSGWWPCQLAYRKEGLYMIAFDGWDDTHNEILSKDMLRPWGGESPYDPQSNYIVRYFQFDKSDTNIENILLTEITRKAREDFKRRRQDQHRRQVREDLRNGREVPRDERKLTDGELEMEADDREDEFRQDAENRLAGVNEAIIKWAISRPPEFDHIRDRANLLHLGYCPSKGNCIVMIGVNSAVATAKLALRYLFLLQKRWIANEEGQMARHVQTKEEISKLDNAKRDAVTFPAFLTQFVIGRNGNNITQIRKDVGPDLLTCEVVKDGECLLIATTDEALQQARDRVEMVVRYVGVPSTAVRDIIGPGGKTITKLEKDSNVTFIQTEDRFNGRYGPQIDGDPEIRRPDVRDGETLMVIVGPRQDVETCVDLLTVHVDYVMRIRAAKLRNEQVNIELENLNGDRPPDDDDFPEMGDTNYGGRPYNPGQRRRGNRAYRPRSSGSMNENDENMDDGNGNMDEDEDDIDDYYDRQPQEDEDPSYRSNDNRGRRNQRPNMVYRPKNVTNVSKGQSSETAN